MFKHKFLSLFVALICAVQLFAYNAYIDGIYYNLNTTNKTAAVTNETGYYDALSYSGVIVIPPTITYDSQTYSVTTIGGWAFAYCEGLTSVTIPNSVTTIGGWAFFYCSGLTSVTIPNSVTGIGSDAFYDCSSLTSINVDAANTHYTSIDGVLFNYAKDTLIQYPIGNTRTIYAIPNSVTTIGEYAFFYCSGLTSVTIPNSVTTIGEDAFAGCTSLPVINNLRYADTYLVEAVDKTLSTYTIKEDTKWIGESAFRGCSGLTSVTIPNSVTTIGSSAFRGCSGLTSVTIPNSVTTIGSSAFEDCSGLTSVTIGNSVTTIGYGAFEGCSGLKKTNYTGTIADWCKIKFGGYDVNPMYYSHNFYINDVEIKDLVIPEDVDTIGDYAFAWCSGLTSVTIPNSVTGIGSYAFYDCSSLTSINVDAANTHYTSIDGVLFNYAKDTLIQYPIGNTRTIYAIPNSVTTIGDLAFYECSGLTSITCEATTPPTCESDCFDSVDPSIPLYVPAESVEAYRKAEGWQDFTNILPITAEEVEVTEPETEPTNNSVVISWPSVADGETYTIEIRKGEELICTLVFNANGQLMSINFAAPARGGEHSSRYATATATGWTYTITGLEVGTEYTYTIVAKDNGGKTLYSETGSFKTTEIITSVENVDSQKSQIESHKFIRNGILYIERNGKTYNAVGGRVN